jgi:co-chaperonin GroES (HSP10)
VSEITSKAAFGPHQITKTSFKPIGQHVIVSGMEFTERFTKSGIVLLNDDMKSHGIRPRWAQVYALGPDFNAISDLAVGKWIYITHGRWTRGIEIEDETGKHTLRRVDPDDILLISDEPVNDLTIGDKGV